MAIKYASHLTNRRETPQTEPIPGEQQSKNNAGGYVYEVDKWQRLTRFLILGSDGGTYYVKERELTRGNAAVVDACLNEDASRTIAEIATISNFGRAPKNDQAVFALAIAVSHTDVNTRKMAYDALPQVCRIPTHLFQFLAACKVMRGWSAGLRRAVSEWYDRWDVNQLAYELAKYQQRDGWSNRDAFRLSHLKLLPEKQSTMRWAIRADTDERMVEDKVRKQVRTYQNVGELPAILQAFEEAKTADAARLCELIRTYGLTREMVPSAALNDVAVWEALLEKMPMTAMIRNLGKMTSVGLLKSLKGDAVKHVVNQLASPVKLRQARIHPMAILNAMRTYAKGHGDKGSLTWEPVGQIVDALDAAFYLAFGHVEPTNQALMLALDISGSMGIEGIAGTSLTAREASAAMALITMNVEKEYGVFGFCTEFMELKISPRQRLDDVIRYVSQLRMGGTDCSLPMLYAAKNKLAVDAFIVYTDSETWAGGIHPKQALKKYRDMMSRPRAAEIVVGMTATEFTIADPADPRTLDVVGFDLATPQAMSEWLMA